MRWWKPPPEESSILARSPPRPPAELFYLYVSTFGRVGDRLCVVKEPKDVP
jgi:hypothetical protein